MLPNPTLSQLGCAVNGTDTTRIRDTCLRECLKRLQAACRALARLGAPLQEAVAMFRSALNLVGNMPQDCLCWRDKRALRRVLTQARQLDTRLSASCPA